MGVPALSKRRVGCLSVALSLLSELLLPRGACPIVLLGSAGQSAVHVGHSRCRPNVGLEGLCEGCEAGEISAGTGSREKRTTDIRDSCVHASHDFPTTTAAGGVAGRWINRCAGHLMARFRPKFFAHTTSRAGTCRTGGSANGSSR